MPRPAALRPNELLHISMDPDLKGRIEILLYSELEQRIPKGAWKAFVEARLREWLDWRPAELDAYGFPPGYFITGPAEMVEAVTAKLKGTQ